MEAVLLLREGNNRHTDIKKLSLMTICFPKWEIPCVIA